MATKIKNRTLTGSETMKFKIPCPVCGRVHHIKNKGSTIKCICGSKLILINGVNGKELIKI